MGNGWVGNPKNALSMCSWEIGKIFSGRNSQKWKPAIFWKWKGSQIHLFFLGGQSKDHHFGFEGTNLNLLDRFCASNFIPAFHILHQLIWRIYHYLQGFNTSQMVQDFFHQQYHFLLTRCPGLLPHRQWSGYRASVAQNRTYLTSLLVSLRWMNFWEAQNGRLGSSILGIWIQFRCFLWQFITRWWCRALLWDLLPKKMIWEDDSNFTNMFQKVLFNHQTTHFGSVRPSNFIQRLEESSHFRHQPHGMMGNGTHFLVIKNANGWLNAKFHEEKTDAWFEGFYSFGIWGWFIMAEVKHSLPMNSIWTKFCPGR